MSHYPAGNLEAPLLMNGTRLIVKCLMKNIIVAKILTGVATGEEALIARIGLIPSDGFVKYKRVLFPVKPAFCLTCNKAQLGQSYKYAGFHLNLESLAMARCSWGAQDVTARKTSAFTATEQGPRTSHPVKAVEPQRKLKLKQVIISFILLKVL